MQDLDSSAQSALSVQIPDGTYTATQTGTGVDAHDYRSATVVIDVGAYTDGTHTIEVQESDDDSDYSAVPDGRLSGAEPVIDAGGDADTVTKIGVLATKTFLRVVSTVTGTTSGATYGAYIMLTNARHEV